MNDSLAGIVTDPFDPVLPMALLLLGAWCGVNGLGYAASAFLCFAAVLIYWPLYSARRTDTTLASEFYPHHD